MSEILLKEGEYVNVTTDPAYKEAVDSENIYVDYVNIAKSVAIGKRVYIDDGLLSLLVVEKSETSLKCRIENGGYLGSRKGVNLPGSVVDLPALSEKDINDIKFGIEQDVDVIFASFIRKAADIAEIRKVLGDRGKHIRIVAKVRLHKEMNSLMSLVSSSFPPSIDRFIATCFIPYACLPHSCTSSPLFVVLPCSSYFIPTLPPSFLNSHSPSPPSFPLSLPPLLP